MVRGGAPAAAPRPRESLARRSARRELIDADVDDAALLAGSYADMARFNRWFGGVAPVRDAVEACGAARALDVGCGYADVPRAIARAARRSGRAVEVVCLDASDAVVAVARGRSAAYPELRFVRARGETLPFAAGAFDAATCTLTLHHCDPPEAVALLRELRRVARRVFVADLRRCAGGLLGAYAISRTLSRNRLTRHDAPLSVRRAYTPAEARELAREAGWAAPRARPTPFFRMLLDDAGDDA